MIRSDGLASYCWANPEETAFDGGTSRLGIFGGTVPANANAALSGNPLLVEWALATDALGALDAATRQAAINLALQNALAVAGGTAAFAMLYRTTDPALTSAATSTTRRAVLPVGLEGSGADVELESLTIVNNEAYKLLSAIYQTSV